jgi:hypothetical protein
MNSYMTAATMVIMGVTVGITTHSIAAPKDDPPGAVASAQVPVPRLEKTIDLSGLGSGIVAVRKATFSPDGRFLAIVAAPAPLKTDIVVWDLQLDRKQSLIHSPFDYGDLWDHDLLWSRDGKVISFGAKRQWDPMTGDALPDNPAIGRAARLNKDGSKMLTIVGAIGQPSYIHIYDTRNWALQKIFVDGLSVQTAAWTAENKIVVGVHVTKETFGKTIDGYTITRGADVALRLLDPAGKELTKAVWFAAVPDDRPKYFPWKQATSVDLSATSFTADIVALGADRLVDGKTLNIITYYTLEELENGSRAGGGGKVFSEDGKYLYIKDAKWFDNRRPVANAIIDASNGKHIAKFSGGDIGIAISGDGQRLAIGNGNSVEILSIQQ